MQARELKVRLIKSGPPNDTIFVLGATGCGKTTLMANLVVERKRFIIFDTKEDFPASFFPHAIFVDSPAELREALNANHPQIIVRLWKQDVEDFFSSSCEMLFQLHVLNHERKLETTFLLDELNNFVYVNSCPKSFENVILRGRGIGIRKIFGAQWFGTVPTWCRDTFTEIYTFAHTDETGLERLDNFGFDESEVSNLPAYHCLHRCRDGKIEHLSLVAQGKK